MRRDYRAKGTNCKGAQSGLDERLQAGQRSEPVLMRITTHPASKADDLLPHRWAAHAAAAYLSTIDARTVTLLHAANPCAIH